MSTGSLSDALRAVAVVMELSCTSLGINRTDKKASKEADANHNSITGASRVVVSRLAGADELHKEIMEIQRMAREDFVMNTMAWGLGSRRLMPNARFQPWITSYANFYNLHQAKVAEFIANAPAIIQRAEHNLGNYDIAPPTVEEITNAYSMTYAMEPLPNKQDLAASTLDAGVQLWMGDQFEAQIAATHNQALQDALARLAKPLSNIVAQMTAMDNANKAEAAGQSEVKRPKIYDSLLGNVVEFADVFSAFNLTGDPFLADLSQKLELFKQLKTDDIKKTPTAQEAARLRAQELLASVNNWLGPVRP